MATDRDMQAFVVAYEGAWASRVPGAIGVDRATLHAAAQQWGSVLPVPLLGLTLLNPDYHAISPEDWRSLGVAAPGPLPDRFDAVAACAREAG